MGLLEHKKDTIYTMTWIQIDFEEHYRSNL